MISLLKLFIVMVVALLSCSEQSNPAQAQASSLSTLEVDYQNTVIAFHYDNGGRTYLGQNENGNGILSVYNGEGSENGLYSYNGIALYIGLNHDPAISIDNRGIIFIDPRATDGGVYFGYRRVLGPRQPAIADATELANVVAQLNKLLAACRAHGLIEGGQLETLAGR